MSMPHECRCVVCGLFMAGDSDALQRRAETAERQRDMYEAVLREIAHTGTSQPPAGLVQEAEWYRGIAWSLIGMAARALRTAHPEEARAR